MGLQETTLHGYPLYEDRRPIPACDIEYPVGNTVVKPSRYLHHRSVVAAPSSHAIRITTINV